MRFCYADPPYYGNGKSKYGYEEWDTKDRHFQLVQQLITEFPEGWALSCNPKDLQWLLPKCPEGIRVCAWVKPWAAFKPNVNPAFAWEAILVRGGRKKTRKEPTERDWISSNITLKRGLAGAKPKKFCLWLFSILGARAGDEFIDMFEGTGAVSKAWKEYTQQERLI